MGYGSITDRTLAENEPPVYVPEYFSATLAPSGPALPGKLYEWWIEVMPFPFVDLTDNAEHYKSDELISVHPGQTPIVLNIPLSRGLTTVELGELKNLKEFACIRVKATYRDGFSKKRQWVSFAYFIQVDGLGFLDKYNDSGEDEKAN